LNQILEMDETNEQAIENKQSIMINPFKVWEKFYFSVEDGLTNTIRDSVHTQDFANKIDLILNSYLQHLKFQKSVVATLMDESPFSSKRDVARVAELLVSLENKVDNLENELTDKLIEIEQDTVLMAQNSLPSKKSVSREEFLELMKPALLAIQDIDHRLDSLENLVQKLDKKMNDIQTQIRSEGKSTAKNSAIPKTKKSPEIE